MKSAKTLKVWEMSKSKCSLTEILTWCITERQTNRLLFTMPMSQDSRRRGEPNKALLDRTLNLFGPFVIKRFRAGAWPGTRLIDRKAMVFILQFDEALKNKILETQSSIWDWLYTSDPPLPEDLCLFLEGDTAPSFVSITHEKEGYLISETKPRLNGVILSELYLSDLLPQSGNYFCRV